MGVGKGMLSLQLLSEVSGRCYQQLTQMMLHCSYHVVVQIS